MAHPASRLYGYAHKGSMQTLVTCSLAASANCLRLSTLSGGHRERVLKRTSESLCDGYGVKNSAVLTEVPGYLLPAVFTVAQGNLYPDLSSMAHNEPSDNSDIEDEFQLYQIVPFPAPAHLFNKSTTKHLYIESPREFIITDNLHQRFAKMTRYQVERCYQLNEMKFVCKEAFPITSYKSGEDCEATLLHPSSTETPSSCSQRMIEIRSTLWIKLFGNEWLHVTPKPEIFTILCVVIAANAAEDLDRRCGTIASTQIVWSQRNTAFCNKLFTLVMSTTTVGARYPYLSQLRKSTLRAPELR
ncbi:hypothetical protein ANN_08765 [Periplaneta americana]|uniref:Uncharacterized protein n=1 Tax=Periplaneta americana TaxID=6978 RepID=A0ABQ8T2C8_PERAM|nr:hypothetical protein ANN_08765 [Periplaneta americana]